VRHAKVHRYADVNRYIDEPNVWYHNNWNADFTCPSAERVGGDTSTSLQMELGVGVAGGVAGRTDADRTHNDADAGTTGQGWLGDGPKWVCNPRSIVQMVRRRMEGAKGAGGFARNIFHKLRNGGRGHSAPSSPTSTYNGCLIYSIGVNGQELEFEHSIQRLLTREAAVLDYGNHGDYDIRGKGKSSSTTSTTDGAGTPFCEIHVFDPDGWHEKLFVGEGIHYHDWGIVHQSIHIKNDSGLHGPEISPKFKTFQDTVKELGHVGHTVDIMKVDCKLCEWDIFQDWFDGGETGGESGGNDGGGEVKGLPIINQLLVEVHGTPEKHVNGFFDKMREENYVIFHKEPNTQTFGGSCQDYAFLKLRPEFFE